MPIHPNSLANLKARAGKGRPKGARNVIQKEHKELALILAKHEIMEKPELLARLTRIARADVGKHLKIENGQAEVHLDPEHTDIIREITVKDGPRDDAGKRMWTETRLKVADPVVPLQGLARIYGLEKTRPTLNANVWVAVMAKAGLDVEALHAAAVATLGVEE
jgi:hypothetical protein